MALYILVLITGSLTTTIQVYISNDLTASNISLNSNTSETQGASHKASSFDTFLNVLTSNYDPIMSILVSLIYMYFFGKIIKNAYHILSQGVPYYANLIEIKKDLKNMVCLVFGFFI